MIVNITVIIFISIVIMMMLSDSDYPNSVFNILANEVFWVLAGEDKPVLSTILGLPYYLGLLRKNSWIEE